MSKAMPPPVTKHSSKSELWEELECCREEIEQQQRILNEWRDKVAQAETETASLRYQLDIIRTVLSRYAR